MSLALLSDKYRRRINYLRISVTDRCNLRCTYCMPPEGIDPVPHADILSYEEFLRVARIAVGEGIRKVRITGGEPLVRKGIVGFLRELAAISGVEDLSLTTNGLLLAGMARDLKRAGLHRVNVSLDTLRPETFERVTRRPGLDRVLAGLAAARSAGLDPVKVNVVVMRGTNDEELLDFAAFAEETGYEIRFIEFMPADPTEWEASRVVPAAEILAALRRRYELIPLEGGVYAGPSRMFQLPQGGRIGVISPISEHFCGGCNRLRLTAIGSLRGCLFAQEETNLRDLLRSGATDQELAAVIREVVARKPERHRLESAVPENGLKMSRIGG